MIAVDAMGGDHAPSEIVWGAIEASKQGVDAILVGDQRRLAPVLDEAGIELPVVHAGEVIEMDDDPARAIRKKKDSSITVAARLVRDGKATGLVSAGSTGATMAAAAFVIGRLPGISRPAIAAIFPTHKVVIDIGANVECRPKHLTQFGVMGAALAQTYLGIDAPRVGLINIGGEVGKGRSLERSAHEHLSALPKVNFVGNVEAQQLAADVADVFVTDGFTGNVLLKTAEGVSQVLLMMIAESVSKPELQEAVQRLAPAFADLRDRLDPEQTGGAHLVGTKGVVVIAHGSSSRLAVTNAITMASDGAEHGLVDRIGAGLVRRFQSHG